MGSKQIKKILGQPHSKTLSTRMQTAEHAVNKIFDKKKHDKSGQL